MEKRKISRDHKNLLFTLKPLHASLNVQIESKYFGCSSFQLCERELMIRSLDSLSHQTFQIGA